VQEGERLGGVIELGAEVGGRKRDEARASDRGIQ
jgi:hypothetical protein